MVLQKQTIDIPLGGLAQHVDPKQVQIGGSLALENGCWNKVNEISKRAGYSRVASSALGESSDHSLLHVNSLLSANGSLIALAYALPSGSFRAYYSGFFGYSEPVKKWIRVGVGAPIDISIRHLMVARHGGHTTPNLVVSDDFLFTMAETSPGQSVSSIGRYDLESDISIRSEALEPQFANPKGVYLHEPKQFVLFGDSPATNILYRDDIAASSPGAEVGMGNLFTDLHSDRLWDVTKLSDSAIVIAYKESSAGEILVKSIAYDGSVNWTQTISEVPSALCVAVMPNGAGTDEVFVFYQDNGTTKLMGAVLATSDGAVNHQTPALLPLSDALDPVNRITVAVHDIPGIGGALGTYSLFAEVEGASNQYNYVYQRFVEDDATTTGLLSESLWLQCGLTSKAWTYNDKAYVCVVYDTDLQASYFIRRPLASLNQNGYEVLGTFLIGEAGGIATRDNALADVFQLNESQFVFAALKKLRLTDESYTVKSHIVVTVDMSPDQVPHASVGDSVMVGGPFVSQVAPNSADELGFWLYPEIESTTGQATGGSMSDGTYSVVAVYEWYDSFGQLHRSAPSPAVSVTLSGGGSSQSIDVAVPACKHTNRDPSRVFLVLYRTENNGSTYYKTASDDCDVSTDTRTVICTESDADLIANEVLYTDGGELGVFGQGAVKHIIAVSDYLFCIPSDDLAAVRHTKPKVEGLAFEFSGDLLQLRIPNDGPNIALGTMDGRIFVFKRNAIYWFAGEGPNALGQGSFSLPQRLPGSVGISAHTSLATTDRGLMFKSDDGKMFLLDRSLQLIEIGIGAEDEFLQPITSSAVLSQQRRVIFTLGGDSNTWAVFDEDSQQWLTYTGDKLAAQSLVAYGDGTAWCDRNGSIYIESDGFEDDNREIQLRIRTPWIKLAGINGYQRCYEFQILGTFKSKHDLVIGIYTDYDESEHDTVTFAADDLPTIAGEPLRLRVKPKRQKATAFMLEIRDANRFGTKESLSISGLSAVIGMKGRLRPLGKGQSK